jgi:hypothetical protein
MALKSFIISKIDYQTSKCWKQIVVHAFETTNKFNELKLSTEGSCLMRLLGPGKIRISQKSH